MTIIIALICMLLLSAVPLLIEIIIDTTFREIGNLRRAGVPFKDAWTMVVKEKFKRK